MRMIVANALRRCEFLEDARVVGNYPADDRREVAHKRFEDSKEGHAAAQTWANAHDAFGLGTWDMADVRDWRRTPHGRRSVFGDCRPIHSHLAGRHENPADAVGFCPYCCKDICVLCGRTITRGSRRRYCWKCLGTGEKIQKRRAKERHRIVARIGARRAAERNRREKPQGHCRACGRYLRKSTCKRYCSDACLATWHQAIISVTRGTSLRGSEIPVELIRAQVAVLKGWRLSCGRTQPRSDKRRQTSTAS